MATNGDERVTRAVVKDKVLLNLLLLWPHEPNTSLTDGSVPARHAIWFSGHDFRPIEGPGQSRAPPTESVTTRVVEGCVREMTWVASRLPNGRVSDWRQNAVW